MYSLCMLVQVASIKMRGCWGVKKIRDAVPFFPIEYIRRGRSHTFLLKPRWNHSLRSCRWHHGLCLLSNGCSWIGLLNCPIWSSSRHSNLQCSPLPSSNCWGCSPVPPAKWLVRLRLCRCHTSARAGLPTSGLDSPQKILSKGDLRHSSKASLKWPVPSLFIAINNLIPVPMAPVEAPALGTEWNPIVTSVIYGSTYPGISFLGWAEGSCQGHGRNRWEHMLGPPCLKVSRLHLLDLSSKDSIFLYCDDLYSGWHGGAPSP